MAITYNTGSITPTNIYRATGGGVTFSANLKATTVFDYFTDTAVVNDAIYFGNTGTYPRFSDLNFNVGTAMAGTGITLVWEYWGGTGTAAWVTIECLSDNTNSFTVTGANKVKFPLQIYHTNNTVNAVSAIWVRCRITAKTTITEGGANQTTAVTASDGKVNIDGYTDASPCSWTAVYDYLTANYSYAGCVRNGNYFDFRRFIPMVNSRLVSKNETIEMGTDVKGAASYPRLGIVLNYLSNGTASAYDPTRGRDGSTYIMNGTINSYPFDWGDNHISYDTEWRNPTVYSGGVGYLGYPSMQGKFYDCKIQMATGAPTATASVVNCRFNMGSGFIAQTFTYKDFLKNTFMIPSSGCIFKIYQLGFTIRDLGFTLMSNTSGAIIQFNSTPTDGQIWTFINPLTRLPGNVDGKPITVDTALSAKTNLTNVFFYDDSAGTYTSYTTAAGNATANDVPVWGDVGDILYIDNSATGNVYPYFTSTLGGTNDYAYKIETSKTGGWAEVATIRDQTNNLTQTGAIYFTRTVANASVAVNGVTSYWTRLTIMTKGTGSPTVDKIQKFSTATNSDWAVDEKYDIQYTAKDTNGNPISGVAVDYTGTFGTTQFSGTSGVDGKITPSPVLDRKWYWNPLDPNRNTKTDVAEISYNPYIKKVRAYGYYFNEQTVTVDAIQRPIDILMVDPYVVADRATAHAYTGIAINGVNNSITITQDMTMQKLYDYCEDWAVLNMDENEPYSTTDGQTYTSTFDLILDGCKLTGNGRIDISGNTLTMTGTSTLDIIASDGVHTNIHLDNIISGSTIVITNMTDNVELFNGIISATSLVYPIVWTIDKFIRTKVMFVGGAWFEASGTLTNSGLTLNINQDGALKPIISYASIC